MSHLIAHGSTDRIDVDNDNEAKNQYLTFTLHGETYALPIRTVKEIIDFNHVTPVPLMPAFIRGVMNLRGFIVPVVDLAARLGTGDTEVLNRTSVVIAEIMDTTSNKRQNIGIMVDAVNEVIEPPPWHVEPPPAFDSALGMDFIASMVRQQDRFLILLAIDRLLSVAEMSQIANTPTAEGIAQ